MAENGQLTGSPLSRNAGMNGVPGESSASGKYSLPKSQGYQSYRKTVDPVNVSTPPVGLSPASSAQSPSGVWQKGKNTRIRTLDAAAHSGAMRKDAQNRARAATTRASTRIRNRTEAEPSTQKATQTSIPLKGGYIFFFLVLGLAIGKDILDVIATLLDMAGLALSATGVGVVLGLPITVFSEVITKIASLFIDSTIMFYFWFTGGKLGLRFVIMSIGAIIDAVPGLDVLPLTTITFVFAFLAGRVISKVGSTMGGGLAVSAVAKKI